VVRLASRRRIASGCRACSRVCGRERQQLRIRGGARMPLSALGPSYQVERRAYGTARLHSPKRSYNARCVCRCCKHEPRVVAELTIALQYARRSVAAKIVHRRVVANALAPRMFYADLPMPVVAVCVCVCVCVRVWCGVAGVGRRGEEWGMWCAGRQVV